MNRQAVASKNISFVSHSDLGGHSDGVQIMVQNGHAYIGLALAGMALATVIGIGGVVLRDSHLAPVRWA